MPKLKIIFLGEGRHRSVYRRGNYVIKIPMNSDGLGSNEREHRTYRSSSDGWLFGIRYARCRIHISGLLIMEYVEPIRYNKSLPKWVNVVDSQQVGYNRRGQLVCYDYGY